MKNQKPVEKWIKITAHIKPEVENVAQEIRKLVLKFEEAFSVTLLYYARYTDLESCRVEISAFTGADWKVIVSVLHRSRVVSATHIADRGQGSLPHALAYQAVKHLPDFDKDFADDNAFLDLLHWMCNMRGLDYLREARLCSFRSLQIAHQLALESEKNIKELRRVNVAAQKKKIAIELADRLNLFAGKRPKPAKEKPSKKASNK